MERRQSAAIPPYPLTPLPPLPPYPLPKKMAPYSTRLSSLFLHAHQGAERIHEPMANIAMPPKENSLTSTSWSIILWLAVAWWLPASLKVTYLFRPRPTLLGSWVPLTLLHADYHSQSFAAAPLAFPPNDMYTGKDILASRLQISADRLGWVESCRKQVCHTWQGRELMVRLWSKWRSEQQQIPRFASVQYRMYIEAWLNLNVLHKVC